jgi:alkanesulfonate monooxygenase SsuD/methylene tetrahydromethanopterin reductase-like flavin-dependent oxidoreductase (luciferase family)
MSLTNVYLASDESPVQLAAKITDLRVHAARQGKLLRFGMSLPASGLAGDPEIVASRIREYRHAGIEEFILPVSD